MPNASLISNTMPHFTLELHIASYVSIATSSYAPSCDAATEFSHCSYSYELCFVITRAERQLGADSRGIILKNKLQKREGMVDFNFFLEGGFGVIRIIW